MKRALTAAVLGGLLTILAPQAASAGSVTPSNHCPDPNAESCAGQPQEARPEQEPPRGAPPSDRRGRDSDEDETILF
jgi:hypothetical protein